MNSGATQRLPGPIICLITDRTLVGVDRLPGIIDDAIAGGVTMVQLREKDLPTRDLLGLAMRVRATVAPPAVFVVNGRVDIAFAVGADGAHLPADGLPISGTRVALGGAALVGRSTHRPSEVERAMAEGADYVELGTIFASHSHPGGETIGLRGISAAAGIRIPLLAIGGITPENAAATIGAGADGVAVISAILAAHEPGLAAERLVRAVRDGYAARSNREAAQCN